MALRPAKRTLRLHAGDSRPLVYRFVVDNGPLDLTGSVVRLQVRRKPRADSPVLAHYEDAAPGANGRAELTPIDPLSTAELGGEYHYDLDIVDSLGQVQTYVYGSAIITPQVTR